MRGIFFLFDDIHCKDGVISEYGIYRDDYPVLPTGTYINFGAPEESEFRCWGSQIEVIIKGYQSFDSEGFITCLVSHNFNEWVGHEVCKEIINDMSDIGICNIHKFKT